MFFLRLLLVVLSQVKKMNYRAQLTDLGLRSCTGKFIAINKKSVGEFSVTKEDVVALWHAWFSNGSISRLTGRMPVVTEKGDTKILFRR